MKTFLFAALCFTFYLCKAQAIPDYCVYLVKGKVTVAKANTKHLQIKQKQLLYKNEFLILAKNSEVTLINKEDKLLVLNTPGLIKVNDLSKKFITASPSVTKSYLRLAFHELLDPHYDLSGFIDKNVGGSRGGVSRGDGCDNLVFPIKEFKTAENAIQFKWHKTSPVNNYTFIIYDSLAKETVNLNVKDTQLIIDIDKDLAGKTGRYYWEVKGKNGGCENDPISFEIINKADEQKLVPNLIFQKGGKDLFSQLQIVDELERDKWIHTAMKYYATIVQNNPDDDPLLKSYVLFLLKYGFNEEAHAAWKNVKGKS